MPSASQPEPAAGPVRAVTAGLGDGVLAEPVDEQGSDAAEPGMVVPPPLSYDPDTDTPARSTFPRPIILALISFLIIPAAGLIPAHADPAKIAFLLPGTVVFVVLAGWFAVAQKSTGPDRLKWLWITVIVVLATALFAVGRWSWVVALPVAGAAIGRRSLRTRPVVIGAACCCALGLGVAVWDKASYGNMLTVAILPPMAAFFAYGAARRNEMVSKLRQTRAELARVAVGEERLRIARDLHDLLGHSLSLITLKAELAGRVIGDDPQRAAREIKELETVARQSLTEVRQAVTSYRQPSLAAEIAAARRMLASAGIECRVQAPASYDLPAQADALLAWTVREGATNIVRHSGARNATITLSVTPAEAVAELSDDGAGPPAEAAAPGSGLTGLAERSRKAGGELTVGSGGRRGFRLRVRIPTCRAGPGPDGLTS
ncbi:MAG: sensor histidine kinase [Micromonosporaceae bacterium]